MQLLFHWALTEYDSSASQEGTHNDIGLHGGRSHTQGEESHTGGGVTHGGRSHTQGEESHTLKGVPYNSNTGMHTRTPLHTLPLQTQVTPDNCYPHTHNVRLVKLMQCEPEFAEACMGLRCSVVWCGVVWCSVVWCSVVWCGVVWCSVVWCGVVCSGVCSPSGVYSTMRVKWKVANTAKMNTKQK